MKYEKNPSLIDFKMRLDFRVTLIRLDLLDHIIYSNNSDLGFGLCNFSEIDLVCAITKYDK